MFAWAGPQPEWYPPAVRRALVRLSIVLAVVAGVFAVWAFHRTGELRSLEPLSVGTCTRVEGAPGAEDIVLHAASGTAFVSSLDRWALSAGEPVNGRIFAYDLAARSLTDVTPYEPAVFRPHGLALYEEDGELLLFVVNHPGATEHTIEILRYDGVRFHHVHTVEDDLLVSPNDVVAVGPRSFYATNDHGAAAGWRYFVEDVLNQARGTVVYWDGEKMSSIAGGLAYANGIAASRFGREIYVAGTTHGVLYVFSRDGDTGALGRPHEIDLGTGADNLTVDRHGMLWIAAHPKLMTHFRYRRGLTDRSPSQVLWVDTGGATDPPVRPVYLNLGEEISASSVAVPHGDRLLIGSVYESFVDCER